MNDLFLLTVLSTHAKTVAGAIVNTRQRLPLCLQSKIIKQLTTGNVYRKCLLH